MASSGYYLALIFKRSVRSPRGIIKCPDQNAKLAIATAELGSGTSLTVRGDPAHLYAGLFTRQQIVL
jgi:hypothetical protein